MPGPVRTKRGVLHGQGAQCGPSEDSVSLVGRRSRITTRCS